MNRSSEHDDSFLSEPSLIGTLLGDDNVEHSPFGGTSLLGEPPARPTRCVFLQDDAYVTRSSTQCFGGIELAYFFVLCFFFFQKKTHSKRVFSQCAAFVLVTGEQRDAEQRRALPE